MTEVGRMGEVKERKVRLIPVCCLGSRADKGLSGPHTLGLWNSSEETPDNEFYSGRLGEMEGERAEREKDTEKHRSKENRKRWRKHTERSVETGAKIQSKDTRTERDRGQTLTEGREGHPCSPLPPCQGLCTELATSVDSPGT